MEKGAIPTSTYWEYYKSGGHVALLIFLVVLLIVAQASCNASDLWLTFWYLFMFYYVSFTQVPILGQTCSRKK